MIFNEKLNVYGEPLEACCLDPETGFARDGMCNYFPEDAGLHLVCAYITKEFLEFSRISGNDLSTPTDSFPGLREGDKWCICLMRYIEAFNKGMAPKIDLKATHINVLEVIPLNILLEMNK